MEKFYKNPRVQAAGLIIAIVIIGWFVFKNPKTDLKEKSSNNAPEIELQNPDSQTTPNISNLSYWEGILKQSDNNQKGNLMLVTKERTIYVKTNRDFNALINKEVTITYEGTLDSFRLGEIKAK